MTNNDLLRRVRYALDLGNAEMVAIFGLAGREIANRDLVAMLKKEGEEGFLPLEDELIGAFLDGLIAHKRGVRESSGEAKREEVLDNNLILRKLRIALELREEDMLAIFRSAGFPVSRPELSALFRAKGQHNYKACGDQLLRNFIKGLTLGKGAPASSPPPAKPPGEADLSKKR